MLSPLRYSLHHESWLCSREQLAAARRRQREGGDLMRTRVRANREVASTASKPAEGTLAFWREVPPARFGLEREPHFVRRPAFVLWRAESAVGIFATGPQSTRDLDECWGLMRAAHGGRSGGEALLHYSDARRFEVSGSAPLLFGHMLTRGLPMARELGAGMSRVALVLPSDWSAAWWAGTLHSELWPGPPTRALSSPEEAWRWLGAPEQLGAAVAALTAALAALPPLTAEIERSVREAPGASLESVAAAVRISPRSLQRALSRSGESFAALRDRVRFELATAQLVETEDKVEAIAAATGFSSRSHFLAWFRERAGKTPGVFRRRAEARKREAVPPTPARDS